MTLLIINPFTYNNINKYEITYNGLYLSMTLLITVKKLSSWIGGEEAELCSLISKVVISKFVLSILVVSIHIC